ncbi:hypothetical protein ACNUI4_15890 [Pseudomonas aeruginosa]
MLAYANGDAWLQPEDGDFIHRRKPGKLQAHPRSQQIAAEEREKAIERNVLRRDANRQASQSTHDAGYRRQESST